MAVSRELMLTRFEDVAAYREARALTRNVYTATQGGALRREPMLAGALRQSAISILASIAAAFRAGDLEMARRHLSRASGSVHDLHGLFADALEAELFDVEQFRLLTLFAARAGSAIASLEQNAQARLQTEGS